MVLEKVKHSFNGVIQGVFSVKKPDSSEHTQIESVNELLSNESVSIVSRDLNELVLKLRKKHLVDEISIAELNGSLLATTNHDAGLKESISSAALFAYITSEINETKTFMIKAKQWIMIMPFNNKLYIVKADANLTEIELKALANDVEDFIKN